MRHHLLIDMGRDDEMILTDLLGWSRGDLSPWSLTESKRRWAHVAALRVDSAGTPVAR